MVEQMKPSGIDWIGDIPESWKVTRLQTLFDQVKEKNSGTKEKNLLSLSYGKIVKKDIEGALGLIPESFDTYNIIKKNDIVLRLTDMQNDQVSLRTGLVKEERGIITSAYVTVRLRFGSPSYYHWYLYAFDTSKQIYAFGQGVRQSLTFEELKKMLILLPSPKEQQAIADYLDKECAQIDSIAADLEKQIALLQQYKKSLITETVTKGVDKSVLMKDSGVEWIGKIPEHWDVEPIKYRVTFHNGDRGENYPSKSELQSEGIPFINAGHLEGDGLNMDNMDYISEEKYRIMGGVKLRPGDILYCLRGSVGKNAIVDMNQGTVASSLVAIRSVRILAEYLYYCLNSHIEEVQRYLWDNGTAQPNLSADNLGKYKFCIPPVEEQKAIVKYLNNICSQIDNLVIGKKKQLSTIQQHKKSLIYEYVTGKKRVKEVR